MAIWKDPTPARRDSAPATLDSTSDPTTNGDGDTMPADLRPGYDYGRRRPQGRSARDSGESLIANGITIEGRISGAGDVRVAGQFQGDVHVQGNLTIESGAKITGGVRANTVVIDGELEGNIEGAARVELHETGVLNGNVKAGSFTVAAGSCMRGQVEFGWDERESGTRMPDLVLETSSTQ